MNDHCQSLQSTSEELGITLSELIDHMLSDGLLLERPGSGLVTSPHSDIARRGNTDAVDARPISTPVALSDLGVFGESGNTQILPIQSVLVVPRSEETPSGPLSSYLLNRNDWQEVSLEQTHSGFKEFYRKNPLATQSDR